MYHTTGFTRAQLNDLVPLVYRIFPTYHKGVGRPRSIGFRDAVVMTLHWLRRNTVQAELGELHGVDQSTVSDVVALFQPVLQELTAPYIPASSGLHPDGVYIVDGSLVPCWSWRDHPENYSGKHHTTGHNIQVACTLDGRLAWVSTDRPGSFHDMRAIRESGFLDDIDPVQVLADKGYLGAGAITPVRKCQSEKLPDHEKMWNASVNELRSTIE
jgi:hypothetical protein